MGGAVMPVGTTAAIVAISGVLLAAGGFVAGRATAPDDVEQVTGLVEAQSTQIDILGDRMAEIQAQASRPLVIDAEIRDTLAQVPPQCRGDAQVDGLACAWATCVQHGASSANRPECSPIRDAYLASMACPEPAAD
jgi:hypothetical protein